MAARYFNIVLMRARRFILREDSSRFQREDFSHYLREQ